MNPRLLSALTLGVALTVPTALPLGAAEGNVTLLEDRPAEKGFLRIFNGKDLTGWEGDPKLWPSPARPRPTIRPKATRS